MSKASDLLVLVLVVATVVWLNVPKLLLPAPFLTIVALSVYRWRRGGKEPMAAERYRSRLIASCVAFIVISVPLLLTILPATVKRWLLLATFLVPVLGAIAASFVYLNRLS